MENVRGTPLQPCSELGMPATGYTRDGICSLHSGDAGSHHVCLKQLKDTNFCTITGQDDWCSAVNDWCVCEWAFERAVQHDGCDAFEIKCEATNKLALKHYDRSDMTHAAECIRRKCS